MSVIAYVGFPGSDRLPDVILGTWPVTQTVTATSWRTTTDEALVTFTRSTYDGTGLVFSQITPETYVPTAGTFNRVSYTVQGVGFIPYSGSLTITGTYDAVTVGSYRSAADWSGLWDFLTAGNDDIYVYNDLTAYPDTRVRPTYVFAGAGDDQINVLGTGDKFLFGGTGANFIVAQAGNDLIVAGDLDPAPLDTHAWSVVFANDGNDTILAGYGSNTFLVDGPGNDVLVDGPGTDLMIAGEGIDYIAAGTGTNYIQFEYSAFVGGQYDTIDYFTAANNYIGLGPAYAPYMFGAQYDSTAALHFYAAGGGIYTIYVLNASLSDVTSHLYFVGG
jgi:Ca2+-binding RTX toxin-like protein